MIDAEKYVFWIETAKSRYRRWLSLRGEWNEVMVWRGYQRALQMVERYKPEQESIAA